MTGIAIKNDHENDDQDHRQKWPGSPSKMTTKMITTTVENDHENDHENDQKNKNLTKS